MTTLKNDKNPRNYHHGDLRNTLIQVGIEMLAEGGEAALSLRKLAQRAGVSHNAPYQHFEDKNALIAAIAEEGFRLLGEAIDSGLHKVSEADPTAKLTALGRAYVDFALSHPNHLQVMFGTFPNSDYPELAAQASRTLDKLVAAVTEVHERGNLKVSDPQDAAAVVWMTVHGLSAILIADKLPDRIVQNRTADALTERFVQMLCHGLIQVRTE